MLDMIFISISLPWGSIVNVYKRLLISLTEASLWFIG